MTTTKTIRELVSQRERFDELKRKRFNHFGLLPVPESWMEEPEIKTMPLKHHKTKRPSVIYVIDSDTQRRTWYSFQIADNKHWKDWYAIGMEDCEVGHAWISATYSDWNDPDYEGVESRVTWYVSFAHDGSPQHEFWGWHINEVSVSHAYERKLRNKTPMTYQYECIDIDGKPVEFKITADGYHACQVNAKAKVDADPNLFPFSENSYFRSVMLVHMKGG